jgi:hypothetical protein
MPKYVELYDLVADPLEKKDLKEKHPAKVTQLKKMLIQWQGTLAGQAYGQRIFKPTKP